METVKELLGHASITTTIDTYGHLSVEDARRDVGGGGLVHRARGAAVSARADRGDDLVAGPAGEADRPRSVPSSASRCVPDPDHPVLGRGACSVAGCDRSPSGNGCARRTRGAGPTAVARTWLAFLADPGPGAERATRPDGCTVPGCRYGSSGLGLCMRHRAALTASGQPRPGRLGRDRPGRGYDGPQSCGLPFCSLWTENERNPFCKAHQTRWRMQGRPDVEAFIERACCAGRDRIDYCGLPPQLKLELQYAVQCRADQARITLPAPVVNWAIRQARDARRGLAAGPVGSAVGRAGRAEERAATRRSWRSPATWWRCSTRAPAGRWSTPATSGGCTGCPA